MKKFLALIMVLLTVCMAFAPMTVFAIPKSYIEYEQFPGVPDTGIMDFSWMNEMPAGQRGFVQVKDDGDFYFEDGTHVKFWGTVCGFSGAFPVKEDSEKIAADLASMGVNFVRIHAIDCIFGGQSSGIVNFANYDAGYGTGPVGFEENLLDRMDYLIYCLKEKGIYIHLDTSAGRKVTVGEGFETDEITISRDYNLRGAAFFDDRCSKLEYDYAEDLLTHVNPYTKKAYCNETAIAVIQRVNEHSSLWVDWGGAGNQDNNFTKRLTARFNDWLLEKYGTREALAQAWTDADGKCALGNNEDPTQGTVIKGMLGNWSEPAYSINGNGAQAPSRHVDWISFLNQLQRDDFDKFYQLCRDLGYGGSINCSNIMVGPVDLSNNFAGDVTEMNWYFNSGAESAIPSLVEYLKDNTNNMTAHLIPYISRASATDKALVVTEIEVGPMSDFRADAFLTIATYGSLQDWDGFCMWIYAHDNYVWATNRGIVEPKLDPAYFGQMGLAAMIFRLGLIKPAEKEVEVVYTEKDIVANNVYPVGVMAPFVFTSKISMNFIKDKYEGDADLVFTAGSVASGDYSAAKNLVASNALQYTDGFRKEYVGTAWLESYIEDGAVDKTFGSKSFKVGDHSAVWLSGTVHNPYNVDIPMIDGLMREFGIWGDDVGYIDGKAISDTKEIVYDYKTGNISCTTDKLCYVTGVIPSSSQVGSIKYTTTNDKATIALISTDNKNITESEALYLYACGRSRNKVYLENDYGTSYLGAPPVYYQDVRGTFFFESDNDNCYVWGLNPDGKKVAQIETVKKDGGYEFELGTYLNYEIRTNYTPTGDELPQPSTPESSTPGSSTSTPESSSSQNSQGGDNGGNGSPIIWIVIAAVVVAAVVVVVILGKKKK